MELAQTSIRDFVDLDQGLFQPLIQFLTIINGKRGSSMGTKSAIALLMLMGACQLVNADVLDECLGGGSVKISVCTEVIASPNFGADQKSLAYRYRGGARADGGDDRGAIADYTESIRLKKDNMFAYAGRARAKMQLQDLPGSIADFTQAIQYLPASADSFVSSEIYRRRAHVYIAAKQYDAALRDLNKAVRVNPSSADSLNTRGVAYVKKREFDRAIADYTAAIKLSPLPLIYANRGYAYEAQGRQREAIADLKFALENDPSILDAKEALTRLGVKLDAITNESDRRVREGKALAEKTCSSCHAVGMTDPSPNKNATEFRNYSEKQPLSGLREPITRAIVATHEQMKISLSPGEIESIVAYVNSLSVGRRPQ